MMPSLSSLATTNRHFAIANLPRGARALLAGALVFLLLVRAAIAGPTVTNRYAVNLAPKSFVRTVTSGTPPAGFGFAIGDHPYFDARADGVYDLTGIPDGAQLDPTGKFYFHLDVTHGDTGFSLRTTTNAPLGSLSNISLGPNYVTVNTTAIQAALDANAATFGMRGTLTQPTWVRMATPPPSGTLGTTQLRYSLTVPNATSYHTIPIYDATLSSYDGDLTYYGNTGDTLRTSAGSSSNPNLRERPVVEFDLSTVPAGTRITKATLSFRGLFTPMAAGETPGSVDFLGFGGDGTFDISLPQTDGLIANSGQVGRNLTYQVSLNPQYIESLLGTGQTLGFLGQASGGPSVSYVAFSQETIHQQGPELLLEFGAAEAAYEMSFTPRADGQVTIDAVHNVSLVQTANINVVQAGRNDGTELSGLLEFDARALPHPDGVVSATLQLNTFVLTSDTNGFPEFSVYAYAGNGSLNLGDPLNPELLLGTSGPITALGLIEIQLDAALLQQLLGESKFVGLLLVGNDDGRQFGYTTAESAGGFLPLLTIHTVPEPGSLALAAWGLTSSVLYVTRNRRSERKRPRGK